MISVDLFYISVMCITDEVTGKASQKTFSGVINVSAVDNIFQCFEFELAIMFFCRKGK